MASITIRNLDDTTKQALRERAAKNGRSMEEEARLLLSGLEATITKNNKSEAPAQNAKVFSKDLAALLPSVVSPEFTQSLKNKRVLLIIAGGIAAYKCLDLIRRLRERGANVRPVMTKAATEFITPLSVGALADDKVFLDLWDRDDEHDVGHIRLSREADLIVVAPCTADLMAKMAGGHANDLASTALMAADKPVLVAPAMNPSMWNHAATRRNETVLRNDGINFVGPNSGEMAESGEAGFGRMAEPMEIVGAIDTLLNEPVERPLAGLRAVVTSGPTHEPIDPVRYIANRSSGKQGHAIAEALADAGAEVILVSGPVSIPDPNGVQLLKVETAREMKKMVEAALPADIGVFVAAVADWRTISEAQEKMKKDKGKGPSSLKLTENPDILKTVGHHKKRPRLVIGFAAETDQVLTHAKAKLKRKGADWIVANDVSPETGVMGGDSNNVMLITQSNVENWPELSKKEVARRLVLRIVEKMAPNTVDL